MSRPHQRFASVLITNAMTPEEQRETYLYLAERYGLLCLDELEALTPSATPLPIEPLALLSADEHARRLSARAAVTRVR